MRRLIFEAEHDTFRDSARRFFQAEVGPHSERWREQGFVDREAFAKAGAQGYLLMWAGEEYGGAGISDFRYEQILMEENARHGDLCFYITLHSRLVAPYIDKLGSAEQKKRFLPGCVKGDTILGIAMTEPGAGSDLAGMKTRAEDKGDHWLLNGSKTYISNGQIGDLFIVAARTDPSSTHGLGLFFVERGMPGFERGRRLKKMGLPAQDTSELFFDNVRVPKANVLGDAAKGFRYLSTQLVEERLIAAAGAMGYAQTAFDITLDYVRERRAFGRPIGTFQHNRFVLAEMATDAHIARVFLDDCVARHVRGELDTKTASMAKWWLTELQKKVVDQAVQLHGGYGYMAEYAVARAYVNSRVQTIYGGTTEIQKEIIGRSLGL